MYITHSPKLNVTMVNLPTHLVAVPLHWPFGWHLLILEPSSTKLSKHSIITVSLIAFPVVLAMCPYSGDDKSGQLSIEATVYSGE